MSKDYLENIDFNINPKDDFYNFCNGKWLQNTKIPSKYSRWGTFEELFEKNQNKIKKLVSECKKNNIICQQIYNLYNTGIDIKKRNNQDLFYLQNFINMITNINSKKDIIKIISLFHKNDIECLFYIDASPDSKNSEINRLHFYHSFLGMPDRDYYLSKDLQFYKEEYIKYIKKLLQNIQNKYGLQNNYEQRIYDLEKEISLISIPKEKKRDPLKNYHKISFKKSIEKFSNLYLNYYLNNIHIHPEYIIFDDINFYLQIGDLLDKYSINYWKEYLFFCLFNSLAPYLSTYYTDTYFNFYGKILSGQQTKKPLWENIVNKINHYLEESVGFLFAEKYFNKESKIYVEEMINNIKNVLQKRIKNLSWMSDNTKLKALQKLNNIKSKIGYPDYHMLKDYNKLIINDDSYVNNILSCKKFNFEYEINEIDKKVNKKKWYMGPQIINAYYNPNFNEIVFPASILQSPFFSINQSIEQNYGGIGTIIGHEIIHAFDDQGSHYDYRGNLNNWWDKNDRKKFLQEAEKMRIQYDNYKLYDMYVNGKLTLGENIADYGGVKIALLAMISKYPKLKNKTKKNIKNSRDLNYIQKFFISWANNWRCLERKESIIQQMKSDPHSPNILRVNGTLSILEEFHRYFSVNENDSLFIPKNKRCQLW